MIWCIAKYCSLFITCCLHYNSSSVNLCCRHISLIAETKAMNTSTATPIRIQDIIRKSEVILEYYGEKLTLIKLLEFT